MKRSIYFIIVLIFLFTSSAAFSATYILHLNGMCSTHWVDGTYDSNERLARVSGATSIDCYVDNRTSVSYSVSQFKSKYLDVYCKGRNWCYIINYSAGDVIMGYINANYPDNWNIAYIYTSAGAGGGSEIAINGISGLFTCKMANELGVSRVRNLYNHNDTNGITVYHIAGYKGIFGSSAILPGEDDGAVAYHSAGACVKAKAYNRLCDCTHWKHHKIAYTCKGYYKNHYGMKMKFIYKLGW